MRPDDLPYCCGFDEPLYPISDLFLIIRLDLENSTSNFLLMGQAIMGPQFIPDAEERIYTASFKNNLVTEGKLRIPLTFGITLISVGLDVDYSIFGRLSCWIDESLPLL
jgi:hypothetical protein